mmetsp:Transcript_15986/g.25804  ORF Transcript_15986/g.25804 Transcript_15986/m.25804 type:complete len:275 (-) Transcript_15986:318-1142(-)
MARLSPMLFATVKNGLLLLSFTVGSAASAAITSCPSSTVPTTTLVRSRIAAVSVSPAPAPTVTVKAVPLGPGGGGSVTVTNLPPMLTSFSLGGGGGAPRSTTRDTSPARVCDRVCAASSGSSLSAELPPGRPSTGVLDPGMTKARTPLLPMKSGLSTPPSSQYSTAFISVRLYPKPWMPTASAANRDAATGLASPKIPTTTRPAGCASIAKSKNTLDVTSASSPISATAAEAGSAAHSCNAADNGKHTVAEMDAMPGKSGAATRLLSARRRDHP